MAATLFAATHEVAPRPTPGRWLAVVAAAVAATTLLIATSNHGPGVSQDSRHYMNLGKNLADGRGYTFGNGAHDPTFPPLFPAVLSVFSLAGVAMENGARLINAAALAGSVWVAMTWLMRNTRSRPAIILAAIVLAFPVPLLRISSLVWSEPLFSLLALLSLVMLSRFWQTDSLKFALIAGVIVSMAVLTRYVGVTLIVTGGLLIALRVVTGKARPSSLLGFLALSTAPIAAWAWVNYWQTGTLFGQRFPSPDSPAVHLKNLAETIGNWYFPITIRSPAAAAVAGAAVGILIILGLAAVLAAAMRARASEGPRRAGMILDGGWALALPFAMFAAVYMVFLVTTSSFVSYDPINNRLLSPAYLPLVLATTVLSPALFRMLASKVHASFTAAWLPAAFALLIAFQQMGAAMIWVIETVRDGVVI